MFVGSTDVGSKAIGSFNVTLTDCILGFRYDPEKQSCVCESIFAAVFNARCQAEFGTITLSNRIWVGQVKDGNKSLLGYGYTRCALDYCNMGTSNITKDFNQRCNALLNREGVGCGQCKENYSSIFGSNQCRVCLNDYFLFFMILSFIFSGLCTMVLLSVLRISIAEGYLNGVLFYSNVIDLFAVFFVPTNTYYIVVFVPLFWISQNLGIPACFFNGMTTLDAYALKFAYIAYLFVLMALASLLSRFVQLPTSIGYTTPTSTTILHYYISYSC